MLILFLVILQNFYFDILLFVLEIVRILNLDFDMALKTIESFVGLEHRMEFVGKIQDIEYYNDSIATIPEATINSIKALQSLNALLLIEETLLPIVTESNLLQEKNAWCPIEVTLLGIVIEFKLAQ